MALLFFSQILLARLMGVEEYGIFFYVISWIAVAVILGKIGLDTTLQRYLPEYISKFEWQLARGILARSYQIATVSSAVLLSLGLIATISLTSFMDEIGYTTVLTSLFLIPLWIYNKITQGALLALKKPAMSQIGDGIIQPLGLLIILGTFFYLQASTVSATTAMVASLAAWLIALSSSVFLLIKKSLPAQIGSAKSTFLTSDWVHYSLPILFISSTQLVMNYADIIMIGTMLDTTQAGIYAAASRLATLATFGLLLVNMIFTPYISELYHQNKPNDLQHLTTLGVRMASSFALPVCFCLWLFGDKLLAFFGNEFMAGHASLALLTAGGLVSVISGSVGFIMSMTGHQRQAAHFFAASSILNIILNLVLIPLFGIEGAAFATATSMVLWNIALAFYIIRNVEINPTLFRFAGNQ